VTVTEPTPDEVTITIAPGAAPIDSVFSRTGAVVAQAGDYTASQITNTPSGTTSSVTVQAAINEIAGDVSSHVHLTLSDVAGGTGGTDGRILGRITAGQGLSEELTATQVRSMINVENGATADQTGAEIKAAYEAEADTNAYTDADAAAVAALDTASTRAVGNQNALEVPELTAEGRLPISDTGGNEATHYADSFVVGTVNGLVAGVDNYAGLYFDSVQINRAGGAFYGLYEDEVTLYDGTSTTRYTTNGIITDDAGWSIKGTNWDTLASAVTANTAKLTCDGTNVAASGALMEADVNNVSGIKTLTLPNDTTITSFIAGLLNDTNQTEARATLNAASAATQLSPDEYNAIDQANSPSADNLVLTENDLSTMADLNSRLTDGPVAPFQFVANEAALPTANFENRYVWAESEGTLWRDNGLGTWEQVGAGGGGGGTAILSGTSNPPVNGVDFAAGEFYYVTTSQGLWYNDAGTPKEVGVQADGTTIEVDATNGLQFVGFDAAADLTYPRKNAGALEWTTVTQPPQADQTFFGNNSGVVGNPAPIASSDAAAMLDHDLLAHTGTYTDAQKHRIFFHDTTANLIEANYPVASNSDNYYMATDTGVMYWCDGTDWLEVGGLSVDGTTLVEAGGVVSVADNGVGVAKIDPGAGTEGQVIGISGGNPAWINAASTPAFYSFTGTNILLGSSFATVTGCEKEGGFTAGDYLVTGSIDLASSAAAQTIILALSTDESTAITASQRRALLGNGDITTIVVSHVLSGVGASDNYYLVAQTSTASSAFIARASLSFQQVG